MPSLTGVLVPGFGQGAVFMALPWVRAAVARLVGFVPYPGTLNVRLDARAASAWHRLRQRGGIALVPSAPEGCGGRLFPGRIAPDVEAAVIVPDVTGHGDDVLELIAPVHVRGRLGLSDDDPVTFELRSNLS